MTKMLSYSSPVENFQKITCALLCHCQEYIHRYYRLGQVKRATVAEWGAMFGMENARTS